MAKKRKVTADYKGPKLYRSGSVTGAKNFKRTATSISSNSSNTTGTSHSISMSPLYYDYQWSTPDKFYFPRNRMKANRVWREVYMRDPAVAAALDMYAELPWSGFDLVGIEDPDIRKTYEDMFNSLNLVPKFQEYTRDYLITGELILHTIFNSTSGVWEKVISHNPDYIRVAGLGLAFEQPLLWLRPTPEITDLLKSTDPRVKKFQKLIPRKILNAFRMNKEIALDPLNTTYIPRLNTSSSIRGTSLLTRLFRIIMYEDFIVNASLAVAQRNAAPLRIFKLGDPATGWLPDEDVEQQFAAMLAEAESDPLAAIIMHHNVSTELVGVSDRVLLISREWDFIERVKLLALGVAKSFLIGETSFACFREGTEVVSGDGTPVPIESIRNGDSVLDRNGKVSKVVNNWCEGTPDKLLEVKTWGGRKFRVTPNHRFPAWLWPRKCSCGCGKDVENLGRLYRKEHVWKASGATTSSTKFRTRECAARIYEGRHPLNQLPIDYEPNQVVEARELRVGDYLKIPITRDKVIKPRGVDRDMARLLGYYVSDGDITYYKPRKGESGYTRPCTLRIHFGLHEKNTWGKDVKEICKRLGFRCTIVRPKAKGVPRNMWVVTVIPKVEDKEKFLGWLIKHGGQYSLHKRLSEEVMLWPKELLEEVVIGWLRGDSYKRSKPQPSMLKKKGGAKSLAKVLPCTSSKNLATQMMLVLTRLGFPVGKTIIKERKERKRHTHYRLSITSNSALELSKLVWGKALEANTTKGGCYNWKDDDFIYVKVQSVKEVDNDKPVYNLEVEGDHTYLVCDGVATCNSAVAGLQTLLERLSSLRSKFENEWMIKKLCEPIAQIHKFHKRSKAELDHRIRIEKEPELIMPKIKWHKSLEPTQDVSVLGVWDRIYEYGFLSKRTYASGAGIDLEVERRNIIEEKKAEIEFKEEMEELGIPVIPDEDEMDGGSGGFPSAPGPSGPPAGPEGASRRRRARKNPYVASGTRMADLDQLQEDISNVRNIEDIEERLSDLADSENRINIEDVLEVIGGEDTGQANYGGTKTNQVSQSQRDSIKERLTDEVERQIDVSVKNGRFSQKLDKQEQQELNKVAKILPPGGSGLLSGV